MRLTGLGLGIASSLKVREGREDLKYAKKGDLETEAFNPLRDNVLGGDDEKLAKVEEGLMLLASLETIVIAPFMMINQTGGQANQQAMKTYDINFKRPNFTGGFNVNGGAVVMGQSSGISMSIPKLAVNASGVVLTGQQMTDLTIAYSANNGGSNGNGDDKGNEGTPNIDINQKPNVSNEKLKNIVNDLYKGQGGPNTIGNGTTMDAVRNEIKTGLPTHGKFHTQKLNDYLNALQRRLRAGDLNDYDKSVVNALIEDITNALKGQ
ncbi:hypothetical protein [Alkaliphilus crotonatoxidans]